MIMLKKKKQKKQKKKKKNNVLQTKVNKKDHGNPTRDITNQNKANKRPKLGIMDVNEAKQTKVIMKTKKS